MDTRNRRERPTYSHRQTEGDGVRDLFPDTDTERQGQADTRRDAQRDGQRKWGVCVCVSLFNHLQEAIWHSGGGFRH